MTTAAGSPQIVPRPPAAAPALRAADRSVADALTSVLSDNTRRVYAAQWRIFTGWCDEVGLQSMPADPLTVARYLAIRAGDGASIATLRLATSAIVKAHEWSRLESPCRDQGVRASLKGWGAAAFEAPASGRRPHGRPAPQARPWHRDPRAGRRARSLRRSSGEGVSDASFRRSEVAALICGDMQHWDDGSRYRMLPRTRRGKRAVLPLAGGCGRGCGGETHGRLLL